MDINTVLGNSSFTLVDYVFIGISLGIMLVCGFYNANFTKTADEFLVGGRKMRTAPVAISAGMLYVSALTIIDSPADTYHYGIESFMTSIVTVAIVPISAFLFIPMFHKMELTSVHQYLGHRFDSTFLRRVTSFTYVLHQTFLTCVVLGLVSTALERHLGLPILTAIIGIGILTAFNITLGGYKATVWVQVVHFVLIAAFLGLLVTMSITKAGGFQSAFELADKNKRLELFNFTFNPFRRNNLYNFVIGYGFITLMEMVTYQPIVQRYSSLPTKRDAIKSIFMSIPFHIVPSVLCMMIGIFLFANYAGCDPLTLKQIQQPHDIVPYFISKNITFLPGIKGFFAACIIGGGVSVCSTSITAAVACTYQDFVSKLGCCKSSERFTLQTTGCRLISFLYAALCTVLTCLAVKLSLLEKAQLFASTSNYLTYMAVLYGPLAALFLMAMFFPCVNKYGAAVGFVGGIGVTGYIASRIFLASNTDGLLHPLPPVMELSCPDQLEINNTLSRLFMPSHPRDVENLSLKAEDFQSLSYLLLTLFGAVITLIIGFAVSILTCGVCLCAARKVPASLLHPMLSFSDCCVDSEERQLRHAISHRYVDRITSVHNLFSAPKLDSKPPSYEYSSIPNSPSEWPFQSTSYR